MQYSHQFKISQNIIAKAANMDKIVSDVMAYRPFNVGDATGATGKSSLIGAGVGALVGGGSAALQGLFTKNKDKEGRKKKKPSILGRALAGAGVGALGGAVLPHAGVGLKPYLAELAGNAAADARTKSYEGKSELLKKLAPYDAALTRRGQRALSEQVLPEISIGEILEMMKNKQQVNVPTAE